MQNFISDSAKDGEPCLFIRINRRGIFKAPMNSFGVSGKHGALFVRVVTNCDYVIEVFPGEPVHRLRMVTRDINSNLAHCSDCFGPHLGWRYSRTRYLKPIASQVAQQTFSHLASCRVAGAQYQHAFALTHY